MQSSYTNLASYYILSDIKHSSPNTSPFSAPHHRHTSTSHSPSSYTAHISHPARSSHSHQSSKSHSDPTRKSAGRLALQRRQDRDTWVYLYVHRNSECEDPEPEHSRRSASANGRAGRNPRIWYADAGGRDRGRGAWRSQGRLPIARSTWCFVWLKLISDWSCRML